MDLCYLQKKSPSRGFFVILILKQVQDDVNVIPVQDDVNVIPVQDDVNVIPNLFRNLFILVLYNKTAKGFYANSDCKLCIVSLFVR